MNLYYELLKKPVFTMEDVKQYYENAEAARSAIKKLLKQEVVIRIRNNMYTCVSGETEGPVANKYQIACAINPTSYISHHTAMEYYGVADQVYYDVYVSSEKPFNKFEFDGYTYCYVASKCKSGIEDIKYSGGVRITTRERSVVDSIKDMDKISGMEEVIVDIEGINILREEKLLQYLEEYHNQFLYQKMGFMLSPYQKKFGLSDEFFAVCKDKAGLSKRYLTKECVNGRYDNKWKLVVPDNMFGLKNGEFSNDRI